MFPPSTGRDSMSAQKIICLTAFFAALGALPAQADTATQTSCDPYKDYGCLDKYLGDDAATRFLNYYKLEWGQSGAPIDPNAPPSRRDGWPATPETTPPMPFTEWPYGA